MAKVEYGPQHPDHFRVSWPHNWQWQIEISIPESLTGYLACNDSLPLEADTRARRFRETLSVDILKDQDELLQLRQQLADLENRLERKKKTALACNIMLSPFRRLPCEIIHEISMSLRPDDHAQLWDWDPLKDSSPKPAHHPPSVLAQTSRLWRRIVQGIPFLWQNMHFDCTPWTGKNINILKSRVNRFARLSRPLPLTIHLDESILPSYNIHTHGHGLRKVMDWFFSMWSDMPLNRIHKLGIRPYNVKVLLAIFTHYAKQGAVLSNVNSFMLREMESTSDEGYDIDGDDIHAISKIFPDMRCFWFGQQRDVNALPAGTFSVFNKVAQLSAITHLFLQPIVGIKTWHSLLKVCSNLEMAWFELDDEDFDSIIVRPLSSVRFHRHLMELILSLRQFDSLHILQPFINLRFPSLTTLRLHFDSTTRLLPCKSTGDADSNLRPERFTDTFSALRSLIISRDNDSLEQDTDNNLFNHTGMYPLFFATPSITSLSLFPRRLHPFLSILEFIREDPDHLLPNLKSLKMGLSLCDVRDTVDSVVKLMTTSLLGTSVDPYSAVLGDIVVSRDLQPTTCDVKSQQRLSSMAIRCRMVGPPWLLCSTIPHRISFARNVYLPQLKALEKRLRDNHSMDISFEVDPESEDGLVSAVPFGMQPEEWFMRRF